MKKETVMYNKILGDIKTLYVFNQEAILILKINFYFN